MPNPYIPKEPNDLIRAADWNQIQVDTRTEIQSVHDHSGGEKGVQIGTLAIADKAVTKAKLGDDVVLGVGPGSIGTTQLADGGVTLAKLAKALQDKLAQVDDLAKQLENAIEAAKEAGQIAKQAHELAQQAHARITSFHPKDIPDIPDIPDLPDNPFPIPKDPLPNPKNPFESPPIIPQDPLPDS